ncbi:Hypothetical_protein [Hexamita inflata]|uniref:Hypothetical_protein n=1 Tax=Hexamita inflata TaxID=28002 RepID=A0AA86U143_9EUKA|nr:Hypothetical protein HINF_LOCUS22124 [Hexamita inflata]CAI9937930.1 Hypothetical protein HINF_LOCUS25575 [Hexamita inflata]
MNQRQPPSNANQPLVQTEGNNEQRETEKRQPVSGNCGKTSDEVYRVKYIIILYINRISFLFNSFVSIYGFDACYFVLQLFNINFFAFKQIFLLLYFSFHFPGDCFVCFKVLQLMFLIHILLCELQYLLVFSFDLFLLCLSIIFALLQFNSQVLFLHYYFVRFLRFILNLVFYFAVQQFEPIYFPFRFNQFVFVLNELVEAARLKWLSITNILTIQIKFRIRWIFPSTTGYEAASPTRSMLPAKTCA